MSHITNLTSLSPTSQRKGREEEEIRRGQNKRKESRKGTEEERGERIGEVGIYVFEVFVR